jgi:hypothetical protein
MPTISSFYGIKISMNYRDHAPPHFHAEYQDYEAIIEIANGAVTGRMPRRALNLIWLWLDEHRDELDANWQLALDRRPLQPIDPLP